eukprot:4228247-Lingulodinium_polyedra.AAC.1
MVDKGWARCHATFDDLAQAAGARAITLSKLGLVSKVKADVSMKHRFIWDLLRSGVHSLVRQGD